MFSRKRDFSDHVFCLVLTVKMRLWLEFCDLGQGSRLSFEGVIVIIICIFSYTGYPRPCILRCLDIENDDMARFLTPRVGLSLEFWRGNRD